MPAPSSRTKAHPDPSRGLVSPERLKEALRLLREAGQRGLYRQELQAGLNDVSARTIDRILSVLEGDGAVLQRTRVGSKLRISIIQAPRWDDHVNATARLALHLAAIALSQSGTLLWDDHLKALFQLTDQHMSPRERKLFETLRQSIVVHGGEADVIESPAALEPLLKAMEDKREIEVSYTPAMADAPKIYTLVPYKLSHDLFSGGAFLLAWDPSKGIARHLRLNRINEVRVLPRQGGYPEQTMDRASRFQIGGWTSSGEPFEVMVRIQGRHWLQAFKEAPPALPEFEADLEPDLQSILVRFKANHENGATRWILQFGPDAEVLAPAGLRETLRDLTARAAARYQSPRAVLRP
jgi:predicted DNA-binding transcriptional regulator YafY